MYQESRYVIVAKDSKWNSSSYTCQGSLRRVYYIIDVWHGFEYSSGSEYISNPFHNNLRHFKCFTKASFHYK